MPLLELGLAESVLRASVPDVCPAAQLVVRWRGVTVYEQAFGWFDPVERQQPTTTTTLFDLASVTKLFVVTTFMTLVEAGLVGLDQPVALVLPELKGERAIAPYEDPLQSGEFISIVAAGDAVDMGAITFRHLLTHTSGLPAWRPLFRQGSAAAARQMALTTAPAYPTGTSVIYSDIGLILLGLAIERLVGQSLDVVVRQRVTLPLGLAHTRYVPLPAMDEPSREQFAPTEVCGWRKRRIQAEVHDENAASLGGVAGHAGLFATAGDVATFGQLFLDDGRPLLRAGTVAEMTRLQAEQDQLRRGLGFLLWSPDPATSSSPFSPRTFGHTGFTGTSLWIDPARQLVVALMTNDVYHGRTGRGIAPLRLAVHNAIVAAVDAATVGTSTEARNERTAAIDLLATVEMVQLIHAEDAKVASAVATELPQIAAAIDAIAARMRQGGRLIYLGAGTSGRLGVLDAAECPPTFGTPPELVVALIAGGRSALTDAVEGAEDDAEAGARDVTALQIEARDSIVGIAASGETPYVLGGMRVARACGALVVSLACNRPSSLEELADIAIAPIVGPEVITGSTRLKAGTGQKQVLNMISTGVMVRLGKTFGNLMVDVQPTNAKLRRRAVRIIAQACGVPIEEAEMTLSAADGNVKVAIIITLAGVSPSEARQRLAVAGGVVRQAL